MSDRAGQIYAGGRRGAGRTRRMSPKRRLPRQGARRMRGLRRECSPSSWGPRGIRERAGRFDRHLVLTDMIECGHPDDDRRRMILIIERIPRQAAEWFPGVCAGALSHAAGRAARGGQRQVLETMADRQAPERHLR